MAWSSPKKDSSPETNEFIPALIKRNHFEDYQEALARHLAAE